MDDLPEKKTSKDSFPESPSGRSNKESIERAGIPEQEKAPEKLSFLESQELESQVEETPTGEEIQLPQPVKQKGELLVDNAGAASSREVKIELPLTSTSLASKSKQVITSAFAWLAEFCRRATRLTKSRFVYQPKQETT